MASKIKSGILYVIPTPLGEGDIDWILPVAVRRCIVNLKNFIVERPKTARQFLKQVGSKLPLQEINLQTLDEHTRAEEILTMLEPLEAGDDIGLISEAGCPGVADPGTELVRLAHQHQIKVMPLVGPCSILLALMASGLNGQHFTFHGYLPVENDACIRKIIELEKQSQQQDVTQIFMETPYRNQKLFARLIKACRNETSLCIASNLTRADEQVVTKTIQLWKKTVPAINKKPAIFLLHG